MGGRPCETGPEVVELLAAGMTPEEIVAAFGVQPQSVARGLLRAGRSDLATPFYRLAWAASTPEQRAHKNRLRRERRKLARTGR